MARAPRAPKAPKPDAASVPPSPPPPPRDSRSDRLLRFVERMEAVEGRKRALMAELGFIKKEAKLAGFDLRVIGQMMRERQVDPEERRTYLALCELYRASLGMLDGTPLGEAARRRLLPPEPPKADDGPDQLPFDPDAEDGPKPVVSAPSADDVKAARAEGQDAAASGKPVTANPYAFDDARRAAWDEGWCAAAGSDGMDIPDAWRRKGKKPGPAKGTGA